MTVRLFTPAEAGAALGGASEMHVRRLVAAGLLRAVDIALPGSQRTKLRIRADDLETFVETATLQPINGGREPPDTKTTPRGRQPARGRVATKTTRESPNSRKDQRRV